MCNFTEYSGQERADQPKVGKAEYRHQIKK
jgi:hypothetical protein